jgi:hypothetical protein
MEEALSKQDVDSLEKLIDVYSLGAVLSALSYICGEKAAHVAENWQDMRLAKDWMRHSVVIAAVHQVIEDYCRA